MEHLPSPRAPSIARRLASMLYDSLLIAAVVFVAAFVFVAIARDATTPGMRPFFQAYLLAVVACYFIWFWLHGGQTLAMKTWRLRLETTTGQPLRLAQALLRFALACFSISCLVGIIWALFDRDRQFLHDRLAKTRIVSSQFS